MASVIEGVDQRTQLVGRNRLELLLFRLSGRQRFGINVFKVQEVIRCPELTAMPKSHPTVRGVAHLRGKTIPVLDLSQALGMPSTVDDLSEAFVIITEYNRSTQGFLVNAVEQILNMNWGDILPPPKAIGKRTYMTAVTKVNEELIEIIDVEKIYSEVIGVNTTVSDDIRQDGAEQHSEQYVVLIVDDSVVARKQVQQTVKQLGVETYLAKDGQEGLDLLHDWEANHPSLLARLVTIISDIEMPRMDGYTLTAEIRKNEALKSLYIILHTSLSGVFNHALVERVGANEFIPKFNSNELADAVLKQIHASNESKA